MFCFSPREAVARIEQTEGPSGTRCVLGAHACTDTDSSAPSGPKPTRHKNSEPSFAEPEAWASLSWWQGHRSGGSRAKDYKLHRQLWATRYGREVRGNVFLSQKLMRYGEKEQKYGQASKYMTCHLANLMLYYYCDYICFLLRDYDSLFIPYRKGNSRFSRLKLY